MIPLRDSVPNVHKPVAVWCLMALNTLVFIFEQTLSESGQFALFRLFGVVPDRYLGSAGSWTGSLFFDSLPFITYMFLHSGWGHYFLNMWVLWIFADNIEDVMGPLRFVIFYLLCGLIALATHMAFTTAMDMPVVGASGAIGGVMGAYFLLYPHARIVTFIPIFFIPYFIEVPAVVFLGIWFVVQLFSGVAGQFVPEGDLVAFWAHTGGFVAGVVLLPLFRRKGRCYYCYRRNSKRYERRD